jgi:polyhydroxybutyrate depolymerase
MLLLTAPVVQQASAAVTDKTLARPEGNRHYIVVEPAGMAAEKRPLVILLHGHGAPAASTVGLTTFLGYRMQDWAHLAEREKVMLMAPEGVKGSDNKTAWNDCRGDAQTNAKTDDVGFISALIDTAIAQYHADPDRIYVYGASNGGGMAYRLGIELPGKVAAIGVQSALMAAHSLCQAPSHPMSVYVLHGTADQIAPYQGGDVGHWLLRSRGSGIGAEASAAMWRKADGLPDTPVTYRFPHLQQDDGTSATRYVWGADPSQVQVALIRIDGGGHIHASKAEELPWVLRKLLGDMNHDVDTAEEMWNFFKDKRLKH